MEFFSQIAQTGYWFISYAVPFLVVLTIVVFFHELGHYLVARYNKVDVDAFSVGFGKELFGFDDKHGTRWKVCLVPLGGYVKFRGDANAASVPDFERLAQMDEEEKAGSFEHKPVGQRAAVVAAGPIANFILAILIFMGTYYFAGKYITDPVVTSVVEDGAAEQAGFMPGDVVLAIDGNPIESFSDIPRYVGPNPGTEMNFLIRRGGNELTLMATPQTSEQTDRFGNRYKTGMIGIVSDTSQANIRLKEYSLAESFTEGVGQTWYIIHLTFSTLGDIIIGKQSADQLGGPIRIAKVSGEVATGGLLALINLAGLLSVSIGLLNLFPIPMLDGGHLVFYAYEALRGKPMSEKIQEYGFRMGLAMVLMLMVFATWNDVTQIFL